MSFKKIRWIYILDHDYSYDISDFLPSGWAKNYVFFDKHNNKWLEIKSNGMAIVFKGYAWDGCTPKWSVFDILIGTPDGAPNHDTKKPKTYYASLIHDVLCQFLTLNPDISRVQADKIFLKILERDGFSPRHLYFIAVLIFGRASFWLKRRVRSYDGRRDSV